MIIVITNEPRPANFQDKTSMDIAVQNFGDILDINDIEEVLYMTGKEAAQLFQFFRYNKKNTYEPCSVMSEKLNKFAKKLFIDCLDPPLSNQLLTIILCEK